MLYFIRHGQTDYNVEARLQGSRDIPLNDFGREQARGNGRLLAGILGQGAADFDYVASPLGRTRETMELVRTQLRLDPLDYATDDRLIEVSFGDWEGSTLGELSELEPERVKARENGKWDFQPPGAHAESYEILSWRVGAWLKALKRPTVCVAHGGVARCLFYLLEEIPGDEAATIDIPQDQILRIDDGKLDWLP